MESVHSDRYQVVQQSLATCPEVKDAVVARKRCDDGLERLVGYFVLQSNGRSPLEDLYYRVDKKRILTSLSHRLGPSEVPEYLFQVDDIPRRSDQTLNEEALPVPALLSRQDPGIDAGAAPDPLWRSLAEVWRETLGATELVPSDDLGFHGGDWIYNLRIRLKARKQGVHVPDIGYHGSFRKSLRRVQRQQSMPAAVRALRNLLADAKHWTLAEMRYQIVGPIAAVQQWISNRREREDLERFQRFYAELANKRKVFYLFAKSGMLHWLAKTLEFIPEDVNVVIVTSALSPSELSWMDQHAKRPFFNFAADVDQDVVWEFLFRTSAEHFGLIQVGTFVLNPGLFSEMSTIADDVAINSIGQGSERHRQYFLTFFAFINAQCIRDLRLRGCRVSPATYSPATLSSRYQKRPFHERAFPKVVGRAHRRFLSKLLVADEQDSKFLRSVRGRLFAYDLYNVELLTLHLYALYAAEQGYRVHRVRHLAPPQRTQRTTHISNEIIHNVVGMVCRSLFHRSGRHYDLAFAANYALLSDARPELPAEYEEMRKSLEKESTELQLDLPASRRLVRDYLTDRGLDKVVLARDEFRFLQGPG